MIVELLVHEKIYVFGGRWVECWKNPLFSRDFVDKSVYRSSLTWLF